MKIQANEAVAQLVEREKPVDWILSPESKRRFRQDSKLYLLEIWMRKENQDGNPEVELWHLHPDPLDPEPAGTDPMERAWMSQKENIRWRYPITLIECPERIIDGITDPTEGGGYQLYHTWAHMAMDWKTHQRRENKPRVPTS